MRMTTHGAALAVAAAVLFGGTLMRAAGFTRVSPGHWNGWFLFDDNTNTIDNSLGEFVLGPDTAPAGVGSLEIATIGTGRPNVATYQFAGTALASITELAFSTYNGSEGNPGSSQRSGYLQFNVDFNGSDTWQRRLVYVPGNNGTVFQDQWQEWDAIDGGTALWRYSGGNFPGSVTKVKSWNQIVSDYPGVRIRISDPFFGVRVGEPYANGYVENIDLVKFGTAMGTLIFDFEPQGSAVCRKSAWTTLARANGSPFSNQGDCVSYVNTGK